MHSLTRPTFHLCLLLLFFPLLLHAEKEEGWVINAFPSTSYSNDQGLQLGAYIDIFNYGKGNHSIFPDYTHRFNIQASWYTLGTIEMHVFYDSEYLIPGFRFTAALSRTTNNRYPFYGFDPNLPIDLFECTYGRQMNRALVILQRPFSKHLNWVAGLTLWHFKTDSGGADSRKTNDQPSLYNWYRQNGIIDPHEAGGGTHLEGKLGVSFDTRDFEFDPDSGIWADACLFGSPDLFNTRHSYLRAAVHWRQYIPLVRSRFTLAYHLGWQGRLAGDTPFYLAPDITRLYLMHIESEGLGGRDTFRGLRMNQLVGDSVAWANVELRCKLFQLPKLLNHEWLVKAYPFCDMGHALKTFRIEDYDVFHVSVGGGVSVAMDRNLIVAFECGKALRHKDGPAAIYIGVHYTF